ncbi:MAG: ATP-binding protein [Propioniciclava sp.]|uniref:sensor histidine kinase n=1 Tax=Propioniciclava sp. TaxID=2038686 RepID=UPI0039E5A3ED
MSPAIAALAGLVFGALIGMAAGATIVHRRMAAVPPPDPLPERRRILDSLRSAAALVGNMDEILAANDQAVDLGVVRGDRIAVAELLDLVRHVRRTGEDASANIDQRRPGRVEQKLAARVLRLDDGTVFVVVDDRSAALRVLASARDFMANATHELKTPIGAITLLAEATEQAADDPEAVLHFSGLVQQEARRMTELVAQIVQLSQLQNGTTLHPDYVYVDDVVGDALDRCRVAAEQRQISLTCGGVTGMRVRGSRESLVTAVVNLIENAIAYSDAKTRVVVTVLRARAEAGDRVAIAVTDNGIGIHPDDQERIFERFYRVDYARSRQTGGTGLGLSIVREIVDVHGGEVSVWSKPGSGSTFTISLPLAVFDEQTEEDAS